MDNNEKAMYTGVTASRNTEVTLRWRRGEVFIALHVGVFSFVLTRPPQPPFFAYHWFFRLLAGFNLDCHELSNPAVD